MIQIRDCTLSYGQRVLFDHISWTLSAHEKVGLVGRNGAGKSTLLSLIAGRSIPDEGSIEKERGATIAYMPQEVVLNSTKSIVHESLMAHAMLAPLVDALTIIEPAVNAGHADDATMAQYAHLVHELSEAGYQAYCAKAQQVLAGLGFRQEQFEQPVASLSVGWKMRLVLAQLLLQEADFYLFDEPANHLDLVAKDWFVDFLKTASFGFILVSHDKYFLNHTCHKICEIAHSHLTCYTGNYDAYCIQREAAHELHEKRVQEQQKYIQKQRATIERFRAKASKASMAQSMLKALDKIELLTSENEQKSMRMSLPATQSTGRVVLTVKNLSFSFESTKIFEGVSFEVLRGRKVALVAANGVGKTTLFNVVTGAYCPQRGTITYGHNVKMALFAQDQQAVLHAHHTVMEECEAACTTAQDRARVRGLLGSFLFVGDDVYKKIGVLSGGEKNRVAMVIILLQNANFLLLDEPTNHLDLISKDILCQALRAFDGTILFVSHDRDFINMLATDIIELTPTGVLSYEGNYDDYLYYKKMATVQQPQLPSGGKQIARDGVLPDNKQQQEQKKKIKKIESAIEKLEQEIVRLEASFADLVYGTPAFLDSQQQLTASRQQLADLFVEWEFLVQQTGG